MSRMNPATAEQLEGLPQEWFERAEEAARRVPLPPVAEDDTLLAPAEAEQQLAQFEQEGGE